MLLSRSDRCDRCSARALVVWTLTFLRLDFCAYHSRLHNEALRARGWIVRDFSDALLGEG